MVIQTAHVRYQFIVPEITVEQARKLIADAALTARPLPTLFPPDVLSEAPHYIFEFENEMLTVEEKPLYIHVFGRQQDYEYDTPTIQITTR
jgi:hypothetical protein